MDCTRITLRCFVTAMAIGNFCPHAFARKTNQAVYEEPFDLGGGGAELTRASQEGVMFANPALMPWGQKFHRWFGMQTGFLVNREAVDLAKSGSAGGTELIDKALSAKVHFGLLHSTSWITNNFGLGVFARIEPDLEAKEFGSAGLPSINVSSETYAGGVMSFATRLTSWWSVGATGKYLKVAEPDIEVALTDETKIKQIQDDPAVLKNEISLSTGTGVDVGTLLFLQGNNVDFRWAIKADDVGSTKFQGGQTPFLQTVHTGVGLTFHGATEALHLSIDYRDVEGVYQEKTFKRVYAGAKLLLRNYVGLAAGLYQGIPSAGLRIDALIFKLGFTAYGREMGSYVGDKQRNLYLVYIGFGF